MNLSTGRTYHLPGRYLSRPRRRRVCFSVRIYDSWSRTTSCFRAYGKNSEWGPVCGRIIAPHPHSFRSAADPSRWGMSAIQDGRFLLRPWSRPPTNFVVAVAPWPPLWGGRMFRFDLILHGIPGPLGATLAAPPSRPVKRGPTIRKQIRCALLGTRIRFGFSMWRPFRCVVGNHPARKPFVSLCS